MQLATPPKFGTQPLDEGDDLFTLQRRTCVDCGSTFETSRHSSRCATCQSLRQGQIGPARVTCRVCEKEHDVPILAPSRLCPDCRHDLDATARHIAEALAAAEGCFVAAVESWESDYARASSVDQDRYHVVCEARAAGAANFQTKYERAKAKGDGLSMLLRSKERCDAVATEVQRVRIWAAYAMREVEAAQ